MSFLDSVTPHELKSLRESNRRVSASWSGERRLPSRVWHMRRDTPVGRCKQDRQYQRQYIVHRVATSYQIIKTPQPGMQCNRFRLQRIPRTNAKSRPRKCGELQATLPGPGINFRTRRSHCNWKELVDIIHAITVYTTLHPTDLALSPGLCATYTTPRFGATVMNMVP